MSGHGGIPYGDRPIVRDGFATPEFLRFLEQLNRSAKGATTGGTTLQTQITANATDIDTLQGQVVTLTSQIAGAQTTAGDLQLQVAALGNRVPVETALAASGAITLVSATPTELVQVPVAAGLRLVVGMVYLTGGG